MRQLLNAMQLSVWMQGRQWTARQTLTSVNNQTVPDTKSEKITSVKTGDTTSSDIYVIVGCVSATILAHYVLKNKESIKGKMFN